MARIIEAFVVGLVLLIPVRLSARDYKTSFSATISFEDKIFSSNCNNKGAELIPVTDTLKAKGWKCELLPRQLVAGSEYGQAIHCLNSVNGDAIGTFAHCSAHEDSSSQGMFILDNSDPLVKSTNFSISCSTVSGERI